EVPHIRADRIDHAPALVPGCARRERILKPGTPFPDRKIRSAHPAALDSHASLSGPRRPHARVDDFYGRGTAEYSGARLDRIDCICRLERAHCATATDTRRSLATRA